MYWPSLRAQNILKLIPLMSHLIIFSAGATCQNKSNCQDCLTLPSCGWDEGSARNGAGECLMGGAAGPKNTLYWHFFDCPRKCYMVSI